MEVTVLESFPVPRPTTNPYIVMLGEALQQTPGMRVLTFSWRTALLGRYDVFHVHWPEILVTGGNRRKTFVRQVLFGLLLLRLRVSRTALVRTLHNVGLPDDATRRQVLLLKLAERITTLWITINPLTPVTDGRDLVQILHGHYRDWFARYSPEPLIPGRLAYFGLIRRYKNVEGLIEAFSGIDRRTLPGLTLSVAGKPDTDGLAADVVRLASEDDRVSLDLRYIGEHELVAAVSRCELVVLPYREMHNSGSVLAALSLSRPVLVPANDANHRLAEEVGRAWVQMYDGRLTSEHIASTLTRLREEPAVGAPDLSRREWRQAGDAHREAFVRAIKSRRRSRSTR